MDGERFDAIARGLASPARRRGVLRGLGAGTVVALLGTQVRDEVEAAVVTCPKAGCMEACDNAVGPAGQVCGCVKTVGGGNPVCVVGECNKACDKTSECSTGFVCSQTVVKCCSPTRKKGRCVQKCTSGTPPTSTATASRWGEAGG